MTITIDWSVANDGSVAKGDTQPSLASRHVERNSGVLAHKDLDRNVGLRSTQDEAVAMTKTETPSFRVVAREQLPWLYSLARRLDRDRAEDIVQECLLRAYRSFDSLRDVQAAPAWFRQILVNCSRDIHRRNARRVDEVPLEETTEYTLYRKIADEDPLPYSDTVHLDFLHSFCDEDVWNVLDRLQPSYRVPLVLVHMEGLTTKDVSRMLGVPQNTVLSWLRRGRRTFEKEMWDYAEEHELLRDEERARA